MTLSKNLTGNQPTTNSDSSSGISSDIARFATNASDTSAMDATTPSSSVNDGRSMVAREGRENQVYTPQGARVVAGGVVYNPTTRQILLISSASHKKKRIIPKGGVENDEGHDYRVAAMREIWEEAGVVISHPDDLGSELPGGPIIGDIPKRLVSSHPYPNYPKTEFHFFEISTDKVKIEDKWPEDYKRTRVWADPQEAILLLEDAKRPELAEAVRRCSLCRK